jgi:transcriptional regulator with XRE-family HTH domain
MKRARKKKNWSQEGASEAIGITRAALGSYEEGRVQAVKFAIQKSIQKVYGIDDWENFITNSNYFDEDITGEELKRRFNQLHPATKKAIKLLMGLTCY